MDASYGRLLNMDLVNRNITITARSTPIKRIKRNQAKNYLIELNNNNCWGFTYHPLQAYSENGKFIYYMKDLKPTIGIIKSHGVGIYLKILALSLHIQGLYIRSW